MPGGVFKIQGLSFVPCPELGNRGTGGGGGGANAGGAGTGGRLAGDIAGLGFAFTGRFAFVTADFLFTDFFFASAVDLTGSFLPAAFFVFFFAFDEDLAATFGLAAVFFRAGADFLLAFFMMRLELKGTPWTGSGDAGTLFDPIPLSL